MKEQELKETLQKSIMEYPHFSQEEKQLWLTIFSSLAEYQTTLQQNQQQNQGTMPQQSFSWILLCGITSMKKLEQNKFFFSDADDMFAEYFPFGNPERRNELPRDGNYIILQTGYFDAEYEEVCEKCGRNKSYTGILEDGTEFTYSLLVQSNILEQEKQLYRFAQAYGVKNPVIYAPYLRRLVYLETAENLKSNKNLDFRLAENGLSALRLEWRAFCNAEITEKPWGSKNDTAYHYQLEENEIILPEKTKEHLISIIKYTDAEKGLVWKAVSEELGEEVQKYIQKLKLASVAGQNEKQDIHLKNMIAFYNQGQISAEIQHIFSKSDVIRVLKGFEMLVMLEHDSVFTSYPEGMHVCTYEREFVYPDCPVYLHQEQRPKIYLCFRKDGKSFFSDRIIYTIHVLQRHFPEYEWKGGYFT